ncbi:hypothetical protein IVB12_15875 [Bradyrhizobium sp. 179]|uniref:hypothetical protein n=1 Tax=Bradyrhizobium sp. 179 TaxID=2782648 RepID=UPI001FF83F92|nr:hypothetical protein [Bradyrhizobium sp. 179]MCK1543395.1 hypothetical protein [Bradyrhizobium sp. 179]
MDPELPARIFKMVERVQQDEAHIGVYSASEAIAVALILDRPDLLPRGYNHILEAIERLGDDWLRACIMVRKAM